MVDAARSGGGEESLRLGTCMCIFSCPTRDFNTKYQNGSMMSIDDLLMMKKHACHVIHIFLFCFLNLLINYLFHLIIELDS